MAPSPASCYFLPTRPQITEGIGRPMYLRADEKPVSRFTPPVRGVPNVVVYQQHPGDGTRRPPAPALVARRGRGDKAALLPAKQKQGLFRFRGDCPQDRRQGEIRLQGGAHRSPLPLQFRPHDHRVGLSRHGFAHGHFREGVASGNPQSLSARRWENRGTGAERHLACPFLVQGRGAPPGLGL